MLTCTREKTSWAKVTSIIIQAGCFKVVNVAIISPLKSPWPSFKKKLNFLPHARILCAKFGWYWPSGSGEDFQMLANFGITCNLPPFILPGMPFVPSFLQYSQECCLQMKAATLLISPYHNTTCSNVFSEGPSIKIIIINLEFIKHIIISDYCAQELEVNV